MSWSKLVKQAIETPIDCGVFAAFNSNIDVVIKVTPERIKEIFQQDPRVFYDRPNDPTNVWPITTSTEFLALLQECMAGGKSFYGIVDIQLSPFFEQAFPDRQEAMGGQAGIIANQMAALGAKSYVYNPVLSARQANAYHPKVMFPQIHNGVQWVRTSDAVNDQWTKVNFIFEYAKGVTYTFGLDTLTTPRANRVILGTRNPKAAMGFDQKVEQYLPQLGTEFEVGFMAGYHHGRIEGRADTINDYIDLSLKQKRALTEKNRELKLHLEYVPMKDGEDEVALLRALVPEFSSFGINENEIQRLLGELGFEEIAAEIRHHERAYSLYQGVLAIFHMFRVPRIQLHNLGYYVVILAKPYSIRPEYVRQACLFASCVNGIKAKHGGAVPRETLNEMASYPLSDIGLKQVEMFMREGIAKGLPIFDDFANTGIMEMEDHYLLVIPAHVIPNPVSTVGMGDTVSSSSYAAEISLGRSI